MYCAGLAAIEERAYCTPEPSCRWPATDSTCLSAAPVALALCTIEASEEGSGGPPCERSPVSVGATLH